MGGFIVKSFLLFGLIGAASGSVYVPYYDRPDFPLNGSDGCSPLGRLGTEDCPDKMVCLVDSNYKNGGRCDCNMLWLKYEKKFPFNPDSEWDESGFSTSDCHTQFFTANMSMGWLVVNQLLSLSYLITACIVIRELKRAKAFKFNATGICLVLSNITCLVALLYQIFVYEHNVWDGDTDEWIYNNRLLAYGLVIIPSALLIDTEITVTWIDLYDRTQKMSKSTSKNIKILRYALRVFGLSFSFGLAIYSLFGAYVNMFIASLLPPLLDVSIVWIGSHLITKTLCPDRKDVSNPNWKVSEAIRRGANHAIGASIGQLVIMASMTVAMRNPVIGQWVMIVVGSWMFLYMVRLWAWLQYLIYGNRKHLQAYASHGSSSYFGFSTIGLNKTVTTMSSKASSVISSRSMAAPSTD